MGSRKMLPKLDQSPTSNGVQSHMVTSIDLTLYGCKTVAFYYWYGPLNE